jgi:glycosyltransferase involved in cell wall biosynthesis
MPMKVLFVSTIYPNPGEPEKGTFNRNLVRALVRQHEVVVLAPVPWTADMPSGVAKVFGPQRVRSDDGIAIYHPRFYYLPRMLGSQSHWFYWWSIRKSVDRLFRSFRPDVVLGYWAHPDGAAAVRIARESGGRSAIIVGGTDVRILPQSPTRRRQIAKTLTEANTVACVSEELRQRVIELGASPSHAHLWHQGVDTDCFRPGDRIAARLRLGLRPDVPLLLWVGRMVPVKGLDVLISACQGLQKRDVAFQLTLVGDGALRGTLERSCQELGIADRVKFVGSCGQACLADWYRAADVTVLPSRSEGLPNVLRESVSCGTPFVASNVGGVHEIADSVLDRLVPPDDPEQLMLALADALSTRTSRPPRAYRGRNWADSAEHLIQLVRNGDQK